MRKNKLTHDKQDQDSRYHKIEEMKLETRLIRFEYSREKLKYFLPQFLIQVILKYESLVCVSEEKWHKGQKEKRKADLVWLW